MPTPLTTPESYIDHWAKAEANERANSQSFLIGLTQILGVPAPSNSHASGYSFEYPVKVPGTDYTTNYIDLYNRGRFVLESKQFAAVRAEQSVLELAAVYAGAVAEKAKKSGPVRGTGAWDDAMMRARGQAERYVLTCPSTNRIRRSSLSAMWGTVWRFTRTLPKPAKPTCRSQIRARSESS